jgi:uncharacterized SAM-binding protein YcdF (DUF218 family)
MTARIFALFIGLFTCVNLLGDLVRPGFDGNTWWIGFGALPSWLGNIFLAVSASALLFFALRSKTSAKRSPLIAGTALTLAVFAASNTFSFYYLLATGRIDAGFPVPLSLLICTGMLFVAYHAWSQRELVPARRSARWPVVTGGLMLFAAFPLVLMLFFGNTDYRRLADAVVVFGARAYADGRLSDALQDRIRTACDLYRDGLAKRLVLSGGPGDGAVHETEAMRRYAVAHGVRAEDIFVDQLGLNTEATVRNTIPLFKQWQAKRVLAVSHFYHLPRVKLAYQRAGVDVCTVPARQAHLLGQIPYSMAREVAAFWVYYVKEKPIAPPATASRSA